MRKKILNYILREQLTEITSNIHPTLHPNQVLKLREKMNHSIELIEKPPAFPKENYICHDYALGLINCHEYMDDFHARTNNAWSDDYPNFITYLVQKRVLIPTKYSDANLILYLDENNKPKHPGIICPNGRIRSKWGLGCIWEHEMFEIPSIYGNAIGAYKNTSNYIYDHVNFYQKTFILNNLFRIILNLKTNFGRYFFYK